jgi:hypothetical protein
MSPIFPQVVWHQAFKRLLEMEDAPPLRCSKSLIVPAPLIILILATLPSYALNLGSGNLAVRAQNAFRAVEYNVESARATMATQS